MLEDLILEAIDTHYENWMNNRVDRVCLSKYLYEVLNEVLKRKYPEQDSKVWKFQKSITDRNIPPVLKVYGIPIVQDENTEVGTIKIVGTPTKKGCPITLFAVFEDIMGHQSIKMIHKGYDYYDVSN